MFRQKKGSTKSVKYCQQCQDWKRKSYQNKNAEESTFVPEKKQPKIGPRLTLSDNEGGNSQVLKEQRWRYTSKK
jgi:hypothetical protein